MQNSFRLLLFGGCLYFLFSAGLSAQTEAPVAIDGGAPPESVDLFPKAFFWLDSTGRADIFAVRRKHFLPSERLPFHTLPFFEPVWLKITVENVSRDAVLQGGFKTWRDVSYFEVFDDAGTKIGCGGENLPYFDRPERQAWNFIPFSLPPSRTRTFFIRYLEDNDDTARPGLFFNTKKQALSRKIWDEAGAPILPYFLYSSFFLFSLFAVVILALTQYRFSGDRTALWYAVYLATVILFYLRQFEKTANLPVLFSYFGHFQNFEAPLEYATFAAYCFFFIHFFYLKTRSPFLYRFLKIALFLFLGLFIVDLLLQNAFNLKTALRVYNTGRLFCFGVIVFTLYYIFSRRIHPQGRIIGLGLLCLTAGIVATFISDLFHIIPESLFNGAFRLYRVGNFPLYVYDVRIGILLEVFCFTIAVNLRLRNELLEKKETEIRLALIKERYEKLKTSHSNLAAYHKPPADTDRETDFLRQCRQAVDARLSDPAFSTDDFAGLLHVSRTTLYRELKKQAQTSPSDYIRQRRLALACRLLSGTNRQVGDIAFAVGFREAAYFTTVFTDKIGTSPTEFRHQRRH